MVSSPKNNAALSQLGNLYQYLVVLKLCFESAPGSIINLEQLGDITTSSGYQYEVKHHDNPVHILNDTHIDFWKTLKNWVENFELLQSFSNLVLLTSSIVKENSLLGQWHSMPLSERYCRLKVKADDVLANRNAFKTITPFIQTIYSFDSEYTEVKLKSILSRLVIKHSSDRALEMYNGLIAHNALMAVPLKSRANMVRSLLGMIAVKGITGTSTWDIERDEIQHHVISQTAMINKGGRVYYPDLENVDCDEDVLRHRCIEEIRSIPYEKQILSAAQDYYYYTLTVSTTAEDDPYVLNEFLRTEKGIGTDLNFEKIEYCLTLSSTPINDEVLISASKKLFISAVKSIPSSDPDGSIEAKKFNRGMIHSYVNTSDFRWRITEVDIDDQ